MDIMASYNSSYTKWRIKCKIDIFLSQEVLSLSENIQFRSSPLRVAAKRCVLFSSDRNPKNNNSKTGKPKTAF